MSDVPESGDELSDEIAAETGLARLLEKLSTEYNFDFREYKRASLGRRIKTRMQQVRVDGVERYIEYLDRHPDEHVALFNTILINVTGFFRDSEAWKVLADEVIPAVLREASDSRSVRLWSIGCSSGEEAYSAAILLAEALGGQSRDFNVKIYATDVDEDALNGARQALYRTEDLKDVPQRLVDEYFTHEAQAYRFRRDLRRWCIFGRHNVAQDPPLSHIDLLMCRNVLIYFTGDLQEKILARFHYATRAGGYLFLGRSESLLARSRWFSPVNTKWRIFQTTTAPAPTVAMAMLRNDAMPVAAAPGRTEAPRLQRVIEALPSAVMVIDTMDNVLVWNAAAESLYDIPGENALNRKFRELDISYRIEGLRGRVEEVKTGHIPSRIEDAIFTRRSGQLVHVEINIVPLIEANRLTAVMVFASEATEHARIKEQMARVAEQHATAIEELQSTNEELETTNEELQSTNEELETTVEELQAANSELGTLNSELERRTGDLKRLEDYQRTVLDTLVAAVLVLNREGVVTTWNHRAEQMWNMRSAQVVGHPLVSMPMADVSLPRLTRDAVRRVLETGTTETVRDVPYRTDTGEQRRTTLRLTPLRDADDKVSGVIGVATADEGGETGPKSEHAVS